MPKFDLPLGFTVGDPAAVARKAEDEGFDGVWSTEAGHDPYLPLAAAALGTSSLSLGTAIAVAFPRSPMVHAQAAWDLQRWSKGRFVLGLGAQVKAHNEKRYGVAGDRPVARMRDLIRAIRAIWHCWQDGTKLEYRGEFYTHTLMTPFFNPGALDYAMPPIYVSAVSEAMLKLAGEEANGIHVHPLHTEKFIDTVLLPTVRSSARPSELGDLELAVPAMIATGRTTDDVVMAKAAIRAQIAFYASTPAYSKVLEVEGRAEVAEKLHALSRRGAWAEMPELVDDELFAAVCTEATWEELPGALLHRYGSRATRLMPYALPDDGTPWAEIARDVKAVTATAS